MVTLAKTITVAQTKGGVGKSTLSFCLGGILADMSQRVLLVDTDDQKTLTKLIEPSKRAEFGLTRFILDDAIESHRCITKTQIKGLDAVLHDDGTNQLSDYCRRSASHMWRLKSVIQKIGNDYDFVIIDTPGKAGFSDLQEMSIRGSDLILAPVVPDYLNSADFVSNVVELIDRLQPLPGSGVPAVPPMLCVLNRKKINRDAEELEQGFRKSFYDASNGKITFAKTVIPELKTYADVGKTQIPAHRRETHRRTATPPALAVLLQLVYELAPHLTDVVPHWEGANKKHFNDAVATATALAGVPEIA